MIPGKIENPTGGKDLDPLPDRVRVSPYNSLPFLQTSSRWLIDMHQHPEQFTTGMKDLIVSAQQGYIENRDRRQWSQSHLYFDPTKDFFAILFTLDNNYGLSLSRRPYGLPSFIRGEKIHNIGEMSGPNQWQLDPEPIEGILAKANYEVDYVVASHGQENIPGTGIWRNHTERVVYQPGVGIVWAQLKYIPKEIEKEQHQLGQLEQHNRRIEANRRKEIEELTERLDHNPNPLW